MKFKKGMFIDEVSLTYEEAVEFKQFLLREKERHMKHLQEYQRIATDDNSTTFMRVVALTVIQRNLEDIEHTNQTIHILDDIIESE